MRTRKWEDITDVLTPEGIEKIKVGQILVFNYEGSRIDLKVMSKRNGRVHAKRITTYDPERIEVEAARAKHEK